MTTHNDESLKPCELYDLVTPEGSVAATEKSAVMAWQRISGTYKTTLEGLLGYEQQGWRVVRRAEQPQPAPMQVGSYPITFDEYAKGCSWTRDVREFGIRRHAFSAGYEAALASAASLSHTFKEG
ncbi:MAG TPA: hypothetical protein VL528_10790 [Oxalicibacterium sp.]|jgi:hypothetical protein|nr:hypothetical protein [Oxalicibacterium sp.]